MGRKKIEIQSIDDERTRRVTFKKRRIGLLKKCMQLSILAKAVVQLKIYNPEDGSLFEYSTNGSGDFDTILPQSKAVKQYAKFTDKQYDLVEYLEEKITKHGNLNFFFNNQESA